MASSEGDATDFVDGDLHAHAVERSSDSYSKAGTGSLVPNTNNQFFDYNIGSSHMDDMSHNYSANQTIYGNFSNNYDVNFSNSSSFPDSVKSDLTTVSASIIISVK